MDGSIRIVGCQDHHRTATRQESIWLLVGGGWKNHGALAFYLGLDYRGIGSEEALTRGIENVLAEAATLGHCLDAEQIAEALAEYRHSRGMQRRARPDVGFEPETAA